MRAWCLALSVAWLGCGRTSPTGFPQGTTALDTVTAGPAAATSTQGTSAGRTSTTGAATATGGLTDTTGTSESTSVGFASVSGDGATSSTNENTSTSGAGASSSGGGCDLSSCYQQCNAQGMYCNPATCGCGVESGPATATGGTGMYCEPAACANYCYQFGKACDLPTCGCVSPDTTGAVGSGTGTVSGTSGGSTTGSTIGTTGSGTGDCRTRGCSEGEVCKEASSLSGSPVWFCACSQSGSADSCASNLASGATVCDPDTELCRAPRDFEPCNPSGPACDPGYGCFPTAGGPLCMQGCSSTRDCSAPYTVCSSVLGPSLCLPDLCGPGTGNGGDYQSCTVLDGGDGFCQPFDQTDGGIFSVCILSGTRQTGQACGGLESKVASCAAGGLCISFEQRYDDGGLAETCADVCNANPNAGADAYRCRSPSSACYTDNGGPAITDPAPGICFP